MHVMALITYEIRPGFLLPFYPPAYNFIVHMEVGEGLEMRLCHKWCVQFYDLRINLRSKFSLSISRTSVESDEGTR